MRLKVYGRFGWILGVLLFTVVPGRILFAQTPPHPVVSNIKVHIMNPPGYGKDWEAIARSLIFLEEGKPFSDKDFSQSIQALRNSKLFKKIDVPDPDWARPPVTLVFNLVPFARIENILITGGFPILESEMRSVMTIAAGDPYIPEVLPDQLRFLEKLFRSQGFINPKVTIHSDQVPETGNYVIVIDVDRGDFYRIEAITLEGNDSISGFWIKPRLTTWQSSFLYGGPSRLVDEDVKKDTQKILDYYRSEHYADAKVTATIDRNREARTAAVTFNIREGPLYEVEFEGNQAFWDYTLKKDLVIYQEGNQSDFGLLKSIRNINERYRKAGYLDAKIEKQSKRIEEGGHPVRQVKLNITEGPRYIVNSVFIEGNRFFSSDKIKKQMLTAPPGFFSSGAYVPATLEEDVRAIKTLYSQNGFQNTGMNSRIEDHPCKTDPGIMMVDVRLKIAEGPQTIVSNSTVKGKVPLDEAAVQNVIKQEPGTPYQPSVVENTKTNLAARVSEKGYPRVAVNPEVAISKDQTKADIVYQVDAGPYVEMGRTSFVGNFLTRRSVLMQEMELEAGDPFSLKELLSSQRSIRDINALESVQFETFGLEENESPVAMLAQVHERKPYYAQFAAGYDTWRNFYVDTAVGTINFLGLNQEIRAELQWSQIGYLGQLGITDPHIFGSRIVANGVVYREQLEEFNQNFGTTTTGAGIGLTRQFSKYYTATLNTRYELRDQYRTGGTPIPPEEASQYQSRSVVVTTPGMIYNSVDSFIKPTEGINSQFTVDISRGLQNSLDNFLKYRLDTRYYLTPFAPVTFAFHALYGYISPSNAASTVPQDQLFYLGGATDVRGFGENELRTDAQGDPVGGETAILGSVELRYNIGKNLQPVTFYDTGAIRRPLVNAGSGSFRSSVGGGLRYITPVGPIGILYGHKLNRRPGESSGAFSFTIGYSF